MVEQTTNSDSNAPSGNPPVTNNPMPSKRANLLVYLIALLFSSILVGIALWSLNELPAPIAIAATVIWAIIVGISVFLSDALKTNIFVGIRRIYASADHHVLRSMAGIGIVLLLCLALILTNYFLLTDPYIHRGRVALDDSLQSNSPDSAWDETSVNCEFVNGQYLVSELNKDRFSPCIAHATNYQNFVFQVQMTIIKGDCGAIVFRRNQETSRQDFFRICQDGSYLLIRYDAISFNRSAGLQGHILDNQSGNPVILKGLNQTNMIAVVANGNNIDLWVNKNHVSSVVDAANQVGAIGFAANDILNPTQVAFRNVKVWTF